MKLVKENIRFKRGQTPAKSLDVGSFRNKIDWENLPYRHYWRVITPDNDCIIWLGPNSFYMIKNWMDDAGDEEWAPTWVDEDFIIDSASKFPEWLKKQGAFNLIEMVKVGYPMRPSWDALEPEVNENLDFKRNINPRKALDIGEKWAIGYHQGSYMYDREIFHGDIDDARLMAAKQIATSVFYPENSGSDVWITFSKWNPKYRNDGKFYRKSDGSLGQQEKWVEGYDEDFDLRIRLKNLDLEELKNDKIVQHD